jgi:hypothetical protein
MSSDDMKRGRKDKSTRPRGIKRKRADAGSSDQVPEGSVAARPEHETVHERGEKSDSSRKRLAARSIKEGKSKSEDFNFSSQTSVGGAPGDESGDSAKDLSIETRPTKISVEIYLATDNPETIAQVVQHVDELVDALGYDGPIDPRTERGSFIRHSLAKIKKSLTSDDVIDLLARAERAAELRFLDSQQAEVDNKVADTLSKLIQSLADVPTAFIQIGSILIIKYPGPQGPEIRTRQLSPLAIRALERFPGIQREPQKALESLALAIADLTEAKLDHNGQ